MDVPVETWFPALTAFIGLGFGLLVNLIRDLGERRHRLVSEKRAAYAAVLQAASDLWHQGNPFSGDPVDKDALKESHVRLNHVMNAVDVLTEDKDVRRLLTTFLSEAHAYFNAGITGKPLQYARYGQQYADFTEACRHELGLKRVPPPSAEQLPGLAAPDVSP